MEFPFPPPLPINPPVLIANGVLVTWFFVSWWILIFRVPKPTQNYSYEMNLWFVAAGICGTVAFFGMTQTTYWEERTTPWSVALPSICVSFAGIVKGLVRSRRQKSASDIGCGLVMGAILFLIIGNSILPTLSHPAEPHFRTQCKDNLKQIGRGMHNYHDWNGVFLPSKVGEDPVSWRVSILRYCDQETLYKEYDRRAEWDVSPNDRMAMKKTPIYVCPSNYWPQDSEKRWFAAYSMLTGPRTVGENPLGTPMKDITDGTSNTLLAVEACGAQIVWTEPRDVDITSRPPGINLRGDQRGNSKGWLSSYHRGGSTVLMGDGSARFVSEKIDPALLQKLATINGGEDLHDANF